MTTAKRLPARAKVKEQDTWDLSSLFENDRAWEQAFGRFQRQAKGYGKYRGKLSRSAKDLAACLRFDSRLERLAERLGTYAFLRTTEDQTNSDYQRMLGRFQNAATRASEAASFIRPELLSISSSRITKFLKSREMQLFALGVERLLRFKSHTLGDKEEQLLAMQGEMSQSSRNIFRQLLDADMKFGLIKDENGRQIELSNTTFMQLLHSPKRSVRRAAFHQYYDQFRGHENTLSAALSGSVQTDIYYARARGYDGALAAALFPDKVPESVYSGLITTVRERLPALYRYYDLRRRKMRLREIHHYDTYVPILAELDTRRTWKQASKTIVGAFEPLGSRYCEILERGLNGRWCDRYPNAGKQSGAFSCGTFDGGAREDVEAVLAEVEAVELEAERLGLVLVPPDRAVAGAHPNHLLDRGELLEGRLRHGSRGPEQVHLSHCACGTLNRPDRGADIGIASGQLHDLGHRRRVRQYVVFHDDDHSAVILPGLRVQTRGSVLAQQLQQVELGLGHAPPDGGVLDTGPSPRQVRAHLKDPDHGHFGQSQ